MSNGAPPYLNLSALTALEASRPSHVTYLTAFENVGTLAGRLFTITLMPYILYCLHFHKHKMRVTTLSRTMQGFLFLHSTAAAIAIPYYVYLVIWWRPGMIDDINDFNYSMVYYDLGFLGGSYFSTSALPVFFLTLERCWILVCPTHPFFHEVLACIFYASVVLFWFPWVLNFLAFFNVANFFSLVGNYMVLVLKIGGDCLNLLSTGVLIFLLKKRGIGSAEKAKNNLVRNLMILEVIFGWIPGVGSLILSNIFGQSLLHDYLGPIATFCSGVEMAFVSVFYYRTLMARTSGQTTSVTKVKPSQSVSQLRSLRGATSMAPPASIGAISLRDNKSTVAQ